MVVNYQSISTETEEAPLLAKCSDLPLFETQPVTANRRHRRHQSLAIFAVGITVLLLFVGRLTANSKGYADNAPLGLKMLGRSRHHDEHCDHHDEHHHDEHHHEHREHCGKHKKSESSEKEAKKEKDEREKEANKAEKKREKDEEKKAEEKKKAEKEKEKRQKKTGKEMHVPPVIDRDAHPEVPQEVAGAEVPVAPPPEPQGTEPVETSAEDESVDGEAPSEVLQGKEANKAEKKREKGKKKKSEDEKEAEKETGKKEKKTGKEMPVPPVIDRDAHPEVPQEVAAAEVPVAPPPEPQGTEPVETLTKDENTDGEALTEVPEEVPEVLVPLTQPPEPKTTVETAAEEESAD